MTADDTRAEGAGAAGAERDAVLANSAVMAVGTVVSRMSGFVRSALLAAALGTSLHADLFNIANTIPNMLYILLAGGVVNAVLVPQLVRAMKNDPDGGTAYTGRIITLAALFLGVVTVVLVVAAPWVMDLFLTSKYDDPALADQRASIVAFARFCLPQVFFYGMFVLVGQVLNARGTFGPMMWAPIANNVISVGVLVVYLFVFGPARGTEVLGPYSSGQELLLGLGATAGIVVQFLVLVPYLRASGYRYRPRFDFRNAGLGHTLRLGVWTVLFVVVNQVAYTVVVRLASGGTASSDDGTGYTIYASAFLIIMVPHSVITVSLATAILPRLSRRAEAGDLDGLSRSLADTLRSALAVVVPIALVLPFVATDAAHVIWGYGASADRYDAFAPSLALFGVGLVFFTIHYLMLRGFYSLERTRAVFWIQCVVAATNILAALVLVHRVDSADTAPALVLAYACSYLVGAVVSYTVLRRSLGGLRTPTLIRFLVRLLLAAGVATAGTALALIVIGTHRDGDSWWLAIVRLVVAGVVELGLLVTMARFLRIREVTSAVQALTRRLPSRLRRRLPRRSPH
jgi:putative peptidoglycan lipid II flippase